jgi:3-deoxy-D-manno-octulosonic-acid transferase
MVVSEEDGRNARQVAGDGVVVSVIGDSRFDQVLRRVRQHPDLPPDLVTACAQRKVLIAGSTHGDDEELLIPVVAKLANQDRDMLTLIVPHDPSPAAKRRVEVQAARYGLTVGDLDANGSTDGASAILVNRTGMLADLYQLGRVAYVGGGFGKGVHSVLEPLAHHLPVITGPHINVSYEARTARQLGIVSVVRGRRRFEANVRRWFYDDAAWEEAGQRADRFVSHHSGATQRIAKRLREALSERA